MEADRIITGLPIFTNTEYLYRETGWERLEEEELGESRNYSIISKTVARPLIYSILSPKQYKVRLVTPFEMATILLFHSVDFP